MKGDRVIVRGNEDGWEEAYAKLRDLCLGEQPETAKREGPVELLIDPRSCHELPRPDAPVKRIVAWADSYETHWADHPVGQVAVMHKSDLMRDWDWDVRLAGVCFVCVHPEWRGHGIGTALLDGFAIHCRDRYDMVAGWSFREELGDFYSRAGYTWHERGRLFWRTFSPIPAEPIEPGHVTEMIDLLARLPESEQW